MQLPTLDGLNWPLIRTLAERLARAAPANEIASVAEENLAAPGAPHRMLAVYLLGFTAAERPTNLALLRERAARDSDWQVQEALAQAFDAWASDYVRHSVGNALRDIRRAFTALVDAETAAWNLSDPHEQFTYQRVLKAR